MDNIKRNINQGAAVAESVMEIADFFAGRFFCNLLEMHSNIDDIPPTDSEVADKT